MYRSIALFYHNKSPHAAFNAGAGLRPRDVQVNRFLIMNIVFSIILIALGAMFVAMIGITIAAINAAHRRDKKKR
jgi:hypothetical protein